ncbi:MAG: hypothetical protein DDT19_02919 [Syntrophomonadaceae bacterium]|nr:hypothetical protein [Bacillota bacterium]
MYTDLSIGQMDSRILRDDSVLNIGSVYTFTFEHGRIFEFRTDSWVRERLNYFMQNFGRVISARRPLFTNRYTITVIPRIRASLSDWLSAFDYSWRQMGYRAASFIIAEAGGEVTEPVGIQRVARGVGETVAEALRPLTPILVMVGIGIICVTMLPAMLQKK